MKGAKMKIAKELGLKNLAAILSLGERGDKDFKKIQKRVQARVGEDFFNANLDRQLLQSYKDWLDKSSEYGEEQKKKMQDGLEEQLRLAQSKIDALGYILGMADLPVGVHTELIRRAHEWAAMFTKKIDRVY